MPAPVAIVVAHALPRDDAREPLGLPSRHAPLRTGVVRDAQETDLAAGPGLDGCPLDDIEEGLGRAARHGVEETRRLTETTLVCTNDCVASCGPEAWIGGLPAGMLRVVFWIDFCKGLRPKAIVVVILPLAN